MGTSSTAGRDRVAEALWRTVVRAGIAGVSVRTVAAEAGVTGGTVQHYFPTRAQMVRYAMELIAARVEERLLGIPRTGPAEDWTRSILLQMLPLDEQRRQEFSIWLAFTAHAATDPALADLKQQTAARMRRMYRNIIAARCDPLIADQELPAALLQAVIDGLSLQLADMDPQDAAELGPRLLDHHLDSLAPPASKN